MNRFGSPLRLAIALALIFALVFTPISNAQKNSDIPDAKDLDAPTSEMKTSIERYSVDRFTLGRLFPVESSPSRVARYKQFYSNWLATIGKLNFDAMSQDGKVDYLLFRTHLENQLQQLELDAKAFAEVAPLMPFAKTITELAEARRNMEKIEPFKIASTLNAMNKEIDAARRSLEAGLRAEPGKWKRSVLNRAASTLNGFRNTLRVWFGHYNGYDPMFTWWVDEPYKAVDQSLSTYATSLSDRVNGARTAAPTMAANAPAGGGQGGGRGPAAAAEFPVAALAEAVLAVAVSAAALAAEAARPTLAPEIPATSSATRLAAKL